MEHFGVPTEIIEHGKCVASLALKIATRMKQTGIPVCDAVVAQGAMLHDVGFLRCKGKHHTVRVGTGGEFSFPQDVLVHPVHGYILCQEWGISEAVSRIALRHDILAITSKERRELGILPSSPIDILPHTWEEKAVLCADASLFLSSFGDALWHEPDCAARGLLDILQLSLVPYVAKPIQITHPILQRANGLLSSLIEYVQPDWLVEG